MCSEQKEPTWATQNAVRSFIQRTPFLSEIRVFNLPPDSFLKQTVFVPLIVSHLPE